MPPPSKGAGHGMIFPRPLIRASELCSINRPIMYMAELSDKIVNFSRHFPGKSLCPLPLFFFASYITVKYILESSSDPFFTLTTYRCLGLDSSS